MTDDNGSRSLSDLIKEHMGDRTQADVATELGVSASSFSRWVSGDISPGQDRIPLLADWLGIPRREVAALVYEASESATARRSTARQLDDLRVTLRELSQLIDVLGERQTRADERLDALEQRKVQQRATRRPPPAR